MIKAKASVISSFPINRWQLAQRREYQPIGLGLREIKSKSFVNLYHTTFLFVTFLSVLPTTFCLAQSTEEIEPQSEGSIVTPPSRFGSFRGGGRLGGQRQRSTGGD